MAFRGHYEHSLDAKDRLTVPARFRAALADGVVLSAGLDPCVEVYPTAEYARFEQQVLARAQPAEPQGADDETALPRPLARRDARLRGAGAASRST